MLLSLSLKCQPHLALHTDDHTSCQRGVSIDRRLESRCSSSQCPTQSTMPAKKRKASSPLSDGSVELEETSEFQQITKADFVDRYRVRDLGEGGDVFYQPDVGSHVDVSYHIACGRDVS